MDTLMKDTDGLQNHFDRTAITRNYISQIGRVDLCS